jgi:gluconate 5-dehydrogenase
MPLSVFDLSGKVALVTGAHRGLGFAIAQGLARAGATVILNGRNEEALAAAAQSLDAQGLAAATAVFDVTDRAAVRASVAAIEREHQRIDILFNNAGIQRRHPFADFPQEDWDALIATNLPAPFIVSQAEVAGMIARRSGKIINIAADERARAADGGPVHGRQRRRAAIDARDGGGARAAQHPGQCDRPGLFRDRNEPCADR